MNFKRLIYSIVENLYRKSLKSKYKSDFLKKYNSSNLYKSTDREFNKVKKFWSKYEISPNRKYYEYFGYKDKSFNSKFISEDIIIDYIFRYLNDFNLDKTLKNPEIINLISSNLPKPKIYIKYVNNFYLDGENNFIEEEQIPDILKNIKKSLLISLDRKNIKKKYILDFKNDYQKSLEILNKNMDKHNFILYKLYSGNKILDNFDIDYTRRIRVVSLLVNSDIKLLNTILTFENDAKGEIPSGISYVNICNSGNLDDYIMVNNEFYNIDQNINFNINMNDLYNIVKTLHSRVANQRYMTFEFIIDNDGKLLLVDIDSEYIIDQRLIGPFLGEFTEEILDEVFNK